MLMNHRARPDKVYLQYKVRYETQQALTPVHPVWFDVRNCSFDPIFDVPGGGRPGSVYSTSTTWSVPYAGRIVAALGHVHGGGLDVSVSAPDCSGRELFRSRPTWAFSRDPEYRVRPRVHEPGPIDMELVSSRQGFPVAAGERLQLTARYDNQFPHTRVMGIMGLYMTRDAGVTGRCGPQPTDVQVIRDTRPGRVKVPLMHVPINSRTAGSARPIGRPPGAPTWTAGGPLEVTSFAVEPANAVIAQGSTLRWRFWGDTLHTVTVADGPQGFSSPNLSDGREFSHRFARPGTYRLYCSLHPVGMVSTVQVVPRR
jgi:plastocyanin